MLPSQITLDQVQGFTRFGFQSLSWPLEALSESFKAIRASPVKVPKNLSYFLNCNTPANQMVILNSSCSQEVWRNSVHHAKYSSLYLQVSHWKYLNFMIIVPSSCYCYGCHCNDSPSHPTEKRHLGKDKSKPLNNYCIVVLNWNDGTHLSKTRNPVKPKSCLRTPSTAT